LSRFQRVLLGCIHARITQHECTSQKYSLFLVPNVWVLPNIILR
jgi:hypothetical protein